MEESSLLEGFVVFDVIPPNKEGADPIIYWASYKYDETLVNQVGIFITFICFSKRFNPDLDCDYVCTDQHEIAFMQLHKTIWMALSIKSTVSDNRFTLRAILDYARSMFSHYFVPLPERDGYQVIDEQNFIVGDGEEQVDPVTKACVKSIARAFPFIVDSVNWASMDFMLLYNSYRIQPLMEGAAELDRLCKEFVNEPNNICENIIILTGSKVLASTFTCTQTRALALGMRRKFKYMYLHNPQIVRTDHLSWLIGLFRDTNGLESIYQQNIYYGGIGHLIVAFKYFKFKIVMTLKPNLEVTDKLLKTIPAKLKPIRLFLSEAKLMRVERTLPFMFASVVNDYKGENLKFNCSMIDAPSRVKLNSLFVRTHEYATIYAKSATVGFGDMNFFAYCERQMGEEQTMERATVFKKPSVSTKMTDLLRMSVLVVRPEDREQKRQKSVCEVQ